MLYLGSETGDSVLRFWRVFIYLFGRQVTLLESNFKLCFFYGRWWLKSNFHSFNPKFRLFWVYLTHAWLRSQPETWKDFYSELEAVFLWLSSFWYLPLFLSVPIDAQGSDFSVQKDGRVYKRALTVPGLVITMACFQCKFIQYYSSSLLNVIHSNFHFLGLTTRFCP